jgi:hypothetical protein
MLRAAHARNPEASSQTALRSENVFVMIFPFCHQQRMGRVRTELSTARYPNISRYECRCNDRTDLDRSLHRAGDSLHQRAVATLFLTELAPWLPWALATPFISRLARQSTSTRGVTVRTAGVHLAVPYRDSRSVFAAATMLRSAGMTSLQARVFSPQSGFTHRRSAGMRSVAFRINCTMCS